MVWNNTHACCCRHIAYANRPGRRAPLFSLGVLARSFTFMICRAYGDPRPRGLFVRTGQVQEFLLARLRSRLLFFPRRFFSSFFISVFPPKDPVVFFNTAFFNVPDNYCSTFLMSFYPKFTSWIYLALFKYERCETCVCVIV